MKGRPYRSVTTDDNGVRYEELTTTYLQRPGPNTFIAIAEVNSAPCDTDGCYLNSDRQFKYDNLGNNTEKSTTRRYLSQSQSAVLVRRSYLSNLTIGVLGVVQTETFEDPSNGKVLLSTKYGYDEDVPCEADLIKHTSGRFVLTSNTSGNAKTWQGYDQYGNIVCRVHPEGGIYRILYDASGNWLKQITNPVGMTSKFEYYGVDGIRADAGPVGFQRSIVDVNGDAIISEYDGFGSKTREI